MNTKLLSVLLVCAVLVGGILGFALRGSLSNNQVDGLLGAITVPSVSTTTHGTALQSSLLFQWQVNVAQSLNDLRIAIGGGSTLATTTASIGFPTLGPMGTTTSTASTTVSMIFNGNGALSGGDKILVSNTAGTSTGSFYVFGKAQNSSTLQLIAVNFGDGTSVLPPTSTYRILAIPNTSPSVRVSTTTTPYNN